MKTPSFNEFEITFEKYLQFCRPTISPGHGIFLNLFLSSPLQCYSSC